MKKKLLFCTACLIVLIASAIAAQYMNATYPSEYVGFWDYFRCFAAGGLFGAGLGLL